MTLLLDHEAMAQVLSVRRTAETLRTALRDQRDGKVQMPPRQTTDARDSPNWLRISSAFLSGSDVMGFKSMNRAAGLGMRYLLGLYRISTGELLALMDADLLTTRRTAATNALGTHLLAPDGGRLGIIGSGVQAQAFLDAYAVLRDLTEVVVFSPRPRSRAAFAARAGVELGVAARAVDSAEEVAAQCPTTVLAMRAPSEPVYRHSWLRPGVHVTGLSSVRWDAREVDDEVWSASDVVVADDRGAVLQSGDGISAVEAGAVDPANPATLPELWELVGGLVGRKNGEQVTLFKSAGNAMQDVAVAWSAYQLAVESGLGRDLGGFPQVKPYA